MHYCSDDLNCDTTKSIQNENYMSAFFLVICYLNEARVINAVKMHRWLKITPSGCTLATLLCKTKMNAPFVFVHAYNKQGTHTSAWLLPKTPGVKVGNILCWQQPFVSKYISKVSDFCGNTKDGGIVRVKLELKLWGRCGCLHRTNATVKLTSTLSCLVFVSLLDDCKCEYEVLHEHLDVM